MFIEEAKDEDIKQITEIHVNCWSEVYDFIPRSVHLARDFKYRHEQWSNVLARDDYGARLFVLRSGEKEVVGFCYCMTSKDRDIDAASELHAAYILPEFRGGISGPLMMQAMVYHLVNLELTPICLWAFDQNPIQRWYQMMGWRKVVRRDRVLAGCRIPEAGFVCDAPEMLLKRLEKIIAAGPYEQKIE